MLSKAKIESLNGPILIFGAGGFIGANLLRHLLQVRKDVFGTSPTVRSWRLQDVPSECLIEADLLVERTIEELLKSCEPRTVFDCAAYGAYSFQTDADLMYRTNFLAKARLLEALRRGRLACYIHAGSSSEYGVNGGGPAEEVALQPNSHYAVSKAAITHLLYFMGKRLRFPCMNLRLYSVYGPMEEPSRLIPTVIAKGCKGELPPFVHPTISRDFVFVDDVCEAFVDAALASNEEHFGESFNIGTGVETTIGDVARLAKELFHIEAVPQFTMECRAWDSDDWYANPRQAEESIRWNARTPFREGLAKTIEWYRNLSDPAQYLASSKQAAGNTGKRRSISAVIACYKDGEAVPILYERLRAVFQKLSVEHEIIFVNDNSPDDTEEVIRDISRRDSRVVGISHSRDFGSQAAFRSGMEIATKDACVLLDGDLQDPPELIEQFVAKWEEGYEVVYGRRTKREASLWMQWAYKLFYRLLDRFSYVSIPKDAGDFSLMDRRVVRELLRFPERDLFLRGIRAFVGFRQTGVDYTRPERMFGTSTNSIARNLGWAKRGIFSFSNTPLNVLSFAGVVLFGISAILNVLQVLLKVFFPGIAPRGFATTILMIIFFGSINILGLSIIGEYVARIFEEVKQRPLFVRRHIIHDGLVEEADRSERVSGRVRWK